MITFKNERELKAYIERTARPVAEQAAKRATTDLFAKRFSFRAKKETSSATSSYQIGTRNPTGQGGGNIGAAGTVTGTRIATSGSPVPALTSLLAVLDSIGFIKNETTP